ncbi:MAG: hypothetical protein HYT08_01205 [Candidatus Levybacteria bacterium]|nr:hypothetical protein [Candidatus Levybacteria bacterium]
MTKNTTRNNLATKTDIKGLRTEFKRTEKSLKQEILKVESKVELIEDKVGEAREDLIKQMKEQHDQVMTAISNFAGRVETLETENSVGTAHTRELRIQVDDHEARLAALESAA